MKKLTYDQIQAQRIGKAEISSVPRLPLKVVLDNVRSLYNVGSMFRTADAVMIDELILTGFTPRPPRKEISKTALGATDTVPWRYFPSAREAAIAMKAEGAPLFALELTSTSLPLHDFNPNRSPLVLILGNEVTGVGADVLDLCDGAIAIPMHGSKHSLNVSIAFGVSVYHFERIWRHTPTATQTSA